MEKIILRSSRILGMAIEPNAVERLAHCSRFTPRIANRLLKRMRDYAQVHGSTTITRGVAESTLSLLSVDNEGLEAMDRRILEVIVEKFGGGPIGIHTLAAALSEEEGSLEDIYEPYLMQLGFLERTPRGRVATERAYQHLGIALTKQKGLLE